MDFKKEENPSVTKKEKKKKKKRGKTGATNSLIYIVE